MQFTGYVVITGQQNSYQYTLTTENNVFTSTSKMSIPDLLCTSQYRQSFSISTTLTVATNQINFQLSVVGQQAQLEFGNLKVTGILKLQSCGIIGCQVCLDSQNCQSCKASYNLISSNGQQICQLFCNEGWFVYKPYGTTQAYTFCLSCIPNCKTCSDTQSCSQCFQGYYFNKLQQICQQIPTCLSNQYLSSNYACLNCQSNCAQCSNGTSCSTCVSGYTNTLSPNQCVPITCASNQYRDSSQLCQNCTSNCLQCQNNISCDSCSNGYTQISQAPYCQSICASNQYVDQFSQCKNCDPSCNTCVGPKNSDCSSCIAGWFSLISSCYQWCPNSYIADPSSQTCQQCLIYTKQCQSCANTCRSCQFGNSNLCLDCFESMKIQSGTCVCKNNNDNRNIFYQCSNDNIAVLQAYLASDSPTLTIEFGQPLAQIAGLNCNQIFQQETMDLLGSSTCQINSSQIIVLLSDDSYIMSNNTISMVKNVLQFQINKDNNDNIMIDTFFLISFLQLNTNTPVVIIQYDQIQSTCNDVVFTIKQKQYDAQRGFYSLSWGIDAVPSLDQVTQQQINLLLGATNNQKSTSLIISKFLIPAGTLITAKFTFTFKVNYSGVQPCQTQIKAYKYIIIAAIQSKYPPIYRYMQLFFQFSFHIETCDQTGILQFYEPLDVSVNCQTLPQLNQSIIQMKTQQIEVDINKYQLPQNSAFDLKVQAVLHSDQSVSQQSEISFTTQISNLFIQIQEGCGRQFSFQLPIKLTGIALDFEIEDQSSPQGINLSWECKSIGSSSSDSKCYDYLQNPVTIPQNVISITIPALTFNPYQTLNFTFSGLKDTRKSSQTIVVVLVEVDIPPLIIQFQDLTQLILVNMNDDINVNIIYDSNISSDILTYAGAVLYNNNVVGIINFDYLKVKFRIWDYFTSVTPQNPVVQVRFTVYNPAYIMPSLSITNFNINLPPTKCIFSVQPSSGYALTTVFTLQITGCQTPNTPLTYQFFYYTDSSDFIKEIQDPNYIKRRQLVDQTPIQQFNTILPSGNLLIMGQAMDQYLATFNSTIQLTILNNQLQEKQLIDQIDNILQINDSQIQKKKFSDLCILGEEISRNLALYNLDSVKQRKINLIQAIIQQQSQLPQRSFLPTFSNKIISQLEFSVGNQQISSTQSVLNQINNILQNQQQLLGNTYQLQDNNNIVLQNLVDSFGMLSSTTQSISQSFIDRQIDLSDQICNQLYNITLPNTGGIQLNGNIINLNCQQLTQKYLDSYVLELKDKNIKNTTNLFGVAYSTFSQNPYKFTPQFQSYTQQLVQNDPSIKITQNNVIKPSIKKLNNLNNQNTNILNNTYIYKFPNAAQSNNTQSCIQQDQDTWSSNSCQTNNFTEINGYYCYCTKQNPTTIVDDLKSIIQNKNLQTAFGSQGLLNLSKFSDFYEFAIVWTLLLLTVLQVGLYSYGLTLDKILRFSGIGQKIDTNKIIPITESHNNLQQNNLLNKEIEHQLNTNEDNIPKQNDIQNVSINPIQEQKEIQKEEKDQNLRKKKGRRHRQIVSKAKSQSLKSDMLTQKEILTNQPDSNQQIQDQLIFKESKLLHEEIIQSLPEEADEKINFQQKQNILSQLNQESERKNLNEEEQQKSDEESQGSPQIFKEQNVQDLYNKFLGQTLFKKLLILHEFFGIFYIFDENLSRPIRFTLFYLRVVHSLSISTVFDETYNLTQRAIIPIISSMILIVGVQIVSLVHKIKVIGRIVSTLIVISLLLLYYYIILSIVSGESSGQSNYRLLYFLVLLGVDFIFMITLTSLLKLQIIHYIINNQSNASFILIKLYNFLDLDIVVLNLNI